MIVDIVYMMLYYFQIKRRRGPEGDQYRASTGFGWSGAPAWRLLHPPCQPSWRLVSSLLHPVILLNYLINPIQNSAVMAGTAT